MNHVIDFVALESVLDNALVALVSVGWHVNVGRHRRLRLGRTVRRRNDVALWNAALTIAR